MHSAKAPMHSANPLSSATLAKEPPLNPLPAKAALPSAKFWALGKGFAECRAGTRQRFDTVGRRPTPSNFFKTLCRVPQLRHSAKKSVFKPLCRVPRHRHSTKGVFLFFLNFLCRVQWSLHSAKPPLIFFCFLLFHLNDNAYIYNRNHNSIAINYKPHLYITNDQICPKSTIYYKPQVHSPQVHKFDT